MQPFASSFHLLLDIICLLLLPGPLARGAWCKDLCSGKQRWHRPAGSVPALSAKHPQDLHPELQEGYLLPHQRVFVTTPKSICYHAKKVFVTMLKKYLLPCQGVFVTTPNSICYHAEEYLFPRKRVFVTVLKSICYHAKEYLLPH